MQGILTGTLVSLLLLINTLFFFVPMMIAALIKLLLPMKGPRRQLSGLIMWIAETWASVCKGIFATFTRIDWQVRGLDSLRRDTSYLVVCNHQSWVDIPVLLECLNRRTPYFKFFLKQELLWVPFLGLAWWALDYPFMKRYPKSVLARHPELKGKDLEITRRACEKFRDMPVTIVNYVEGTRFTREKHRRQNSPYRHLLKPKAGGLAFVLASMGDKLDALLDVTVIYPGAQAPGFWDLLSGRVRQVTVDIRTRPIEPWLVEGDYENDSQFRIALHRWLAQIWLDKDVLIETVKTEGVLPPRPQA